MAELNVDECDHLMGIWKICVKCETTTHSGYIYGCKCLYHPSCPVPRVREDHSCSLEFKQQLITNYVKKTFSTDDVRGAYKRYMENNYLSLINQMNSSNLTKEECSLLMRCWRICLYCETKVEGKSNQSNTRVGFIYLCQCLCHNPDCPFPQVRNGHPYSPCSLQLQTEIVTNYVRKTYQTDNVRTAFKTYMEENLPGLVAEGKPDENTVRIEKLEIENTKHLQELTEARQLCKELRRKNSELETGNEQLKSEKQQVLEQTVQLENEKQRNVEELRSIRIELDNTTARFTRSEQGRKSSEDNWKGLQVVCDHLNDQNSQLELEIDQLKSKNQQEEERCMQLQNEKRSNDEELSYIRRQLTDRLTKSETERQNLDRNWKDVQKVCDELKSQNAKLQEENVLLKQKEEEKKQQMAQILADLEGETEHFKQRWTELQEKYNRLEQLNENLHNDIQSSKVESEMQREQFENEKKEMVSEKNEAQEQLNRISGKFARINHELREMKRKWMEVRATDGFESKEKAFDESNDTARDECTLKFEMDSFQLLFNETQMKISELGKKSFSTRNNKLRKELNQKISPATEILCEVEDEVVNVLKREGEKLQTVLEDLLSIETEFPSASSNPRNDHGDANLLD